MLDDRQWCLMRNGIFDRTPYEFTRRSTWLGARMIGARISSGVEQQASMKRGLEARVGMVFKNRYKKSI